MKTKKQMRLILIGVLCFVSLIASKTMAKPFHVAVTEEITHVDKYFNTARVGMLIQRLAWDSLLYYDPIENKIKPALASSYQWIDNLTIEFTLRKGIKFHNGKPFTADDVVYTLNYVSNPDNKVPAKRFTKWIKNAEKQGNYKVRLYLKTPWPSALNYLAGPIHINPKGTWDKGIYEENKNPVGTGPYKISSIALGKKVVFVKNEDYYEESPKGQPTIKTIVMRTIPDVNTQVAELLSGGVQWIYNVPMDMIQNLKKYPNINIQSGTSMRVGFIMMDARKKGTHDNPFSKLKVRRAIAHAIDRDAIVDVLVKGSSQVVHSACHPSQKGCTQDVKQYPYNPALAKKLLAEAGYPKGFKTKLHAYRDFSVTEAMISYLDAVGIKARLYKGKFSAIRSTWRKKGKEVPMAHLTWGSSSLADISAFTSVFFNSGKDDLSSDQEIIEWIKTGDTETDGEVRNKNYHRAIKKIAEKAYWVPLYVYTLNYAHTKDLDFQTPPDGLPRLFSCKWK